MNLYVRKQETVEAEVLTEPMLERIRATDPGMVKRASIGDYLVHQGLGTPATVVPAEEFRRLYHSEQSAREYVLAPMRALEEGTVRQLADRIAKLERGAQVFQGNPNAQQLGGSDEALRGAFKAKGLDGEPTKSETPKAKGKA